MQNNNDLNQDPDNKQGQDLQEAIVEKFDPQKRLKDKVAIVGISLIGVTVFIGLLFLLLKSPSKTKIEEAFDNTSKIEVKTASEAINADELWRNKLEENLESQEKNLSQTIEQVKTELNNTALTQESKYLQEVNSLKEQLKFLSEELKESRIQDSKNQSDPLKLANATITPPKVSKFNLNLTNPLNSSSYEAIKTSDNYIAAGSIAKAVLLSGADVSTALRASSNPDPIIMRVVDHGTLPRQFKSDLKDCHILGSVYGDLSSERAKVRLEKLSCTEIKTGEVIETEVAGFITGEDGRQGIRGKVVSVDSKFLQNSLIGGVLSGLAKTGTQSADVVNPFTIGMGKVAPPDTKERLKGNLIGGAGTSLDRLSEYYIDRAEAVQPVIQIAAGRKIDIVFTEGVFFGTSTVKKEVSKKRDEAIRNTADQESNQFIQKLN